MLYKAGAIFYGIELDNSPAEAAELGVPVAEMVRKVGISEQGTRSYGMDLCLKIAHLKTGGFRRDGRYPPDPASRSGALRTSRRDFSGGQLATATATP